MPVSNVLNIQTDKHTDWKRLNILRIIFNKTKPIIFNIPKLNRSVKKQEQRGTFQERMLRRLGMN